MYQMKKLFAVLLICASVSVFAQDKAKPASGYTRVTLAEGSGFEVYTTSFPPGAISPMSKRPVRVIYVLSGGTLERTYADGRKVDITYKTGETKIIDDSVAYELKNVSSSTVKLYCIRNK
jgi:quercetin dioxygenase-like cupin family protein